MSAETRVYSVLKPLAPAKSVFRDIAPEDCNTVPRITFQFIGGSAINFVDSATIPSKRNYRVQINVWHNQRDACNALARQVENAMRADAVKQGHDQHRCRGRPAGRGGGRGFLRFGHGRGDGEHGQFLMTEDLAAGGGFDVTEVKL